MKNIFIKKTWVICAGLFLSAATALSQQPSMKVNNSTDDIHLASCAAVSTTSLSITGYDANVVSSGSSNALGDARYRYTWRLYRNGVQVDNQVTDYDPDPCDPLGNCPHSSAVFNLSSAVPGTYYLTLEKTEIIDIFIFNHIGQTSYGEIQTNSIIIHGVDENSYCKCSGSESDNAGTPGKTDNLVIYKFVPGEMFVVLKERGIMIKIKDNGGTGHNMFAVTPTGYDYAPVSGYNTRMGTQTFGKSITDVEYADGFTFVGFADGTILKINGTGGTGYNMFAVNPASSGFSTVPGYNYYVGSDKFASGITDITYAGGYLFISFKSGAILKVDHTGGSGTNLFAVTEIIQTIVVTPFPLFPPIIYNVLTGFAGVPGYNYYVGDAFFTGYVANFIYKNSNTILAFSNGKMLKAAGTGGSGHNMYAVVEGTSDFTSVPGYNYYLGDALFSGYVTCNATFGNDLAMGFSNGKILVVRNSGGTGHNMFAVSENSGGFAPTVGYNTFIACAAYSSAVTDIVTTPSNTFVSFSNGKLLKSSGFGGTGSNMFNANETPAGFVTSSSSSTAYLVGSSYFGSSVTDVAYVDNNLFISLANGKMLKVDHDYGTGGDMFNVRQEPTDFSPLCGYSQNMIGGAGLLQSPAQRKALTPRKELDKPTEYSCEIYPNPMISSTKVVVAMPKAGTNMIIIYNIVGERMKEVSLGTSDSGKSEFTLNVDELSNGIYYMNWTVNGEVKSVKKIVVQK